MIFSALNANFELGVLQLSHLVLKVYSMILKNTEGKGISELQIQGISEKIKVFKRSLGAMTTEQQQKMGPVLADLNECQMEMLKHLDQDNPTQKAMFVSTLKSLLEPHLEKVRELL